MSGSPDADAGFLVIWWPQATAPLARTNVAELWNIASAVATDPRFTLFFINDQFHAHPLHGTRVENAGDRSQTSQRFRKKIRLEPETRRRIVFDMDSPLSPRSVWYLDLNPIPT